MGTLVFWLEISTQKSTQHKHEHQKRLHTCSTTTTELMDASSCPHVFATIYMVTFVFLLEISIQNCAQATSIELVTPHMQYWYRRFHGRYISIRLFATIYMDTFVFWLEIRIQKCMPATSIEPTIPHMQYWYHRSHGRFISSRRICDYIYGHFCILTWN